MRLRFYDKRKYETIYASYSHILFIPFIKHKYFLITHYKKIYIYISNKIQRKKFLHISDFIIDFISEVQNYELINMVAIYEKLKLYALR